MPTTIHTQGLDIELHPDESFNKVRQRVNQALTGTNREGQKDEGRRVKPLNDVTFFTDLGDGDRGRIALNPEKIIAVSSTEAKDTGGED